MSYRLKIGEWRERREREGRKKRKLKTGSEEGGDGKAKQHVLFFTSAADL